MHEYRERKKRKEEDFINRPQIRSTISQIAYEPLVSHDSYATVEGGDLKINCYQTIVKKPQDENRRQRERESNHKTLNVNKGDATKLAETAISR